MFSIQPFIDNVETQAIEQLEDKQVQFIISQWLSVGYQKKGDNGVSTLYPPHRITHIQIVESKLVTL
jgi:hypothetical protein